MYIQGERIESKIIPIVSTQLGLSEDTVEIINKFQWRIAEEATKTCNSIEVTGFFKIMVHPNLLDSRMLTIEKMKEFIKTKLSTPVEEKESAILSRKLLFLEKEVDFLNMKK